MKAGWRVVCCEVVILAGAGISSLWTQDGASQPSVLHIAQSQTTSQPSTSQRGFPTYLAMYHVLDGAKSPVEFLGLTGTLSLKNFDPQFSEVLWLLVYWQGECPEHDITLSRAAGVLWSDILKNPPTRIPHSS
jgi:hypothetical protein